MAPAWALHRLRTNFSGLDVAMEDIACRSPEDLNTIFTIGHSTRTLAEFMSLLEEVQVDLVVDVRSIPRSRTNPQFNLDVLPEALAAAGIGYRRGWPRESRVSEADRMVRDVRF